jgi:hypothetical protein
MDIKDVRLLAAKVEFKAKSDSAYLERLKKDPVKVLQDEGFEYPMAMEVTSQLRGETMDEARACSICDGPTCIVTGCCWFTTVEPGPLA